MTIGRPLMFVLLSLGSIAGAVGCCYGYLVLAFKVGNTNQSPTVERIAIVWLLGAATCVCLTIGFAVAAWLSRAKA
jgi:hypothetical protein